MSDVDVNVIIRRAAGREPAQPARDDHGRFVGMPEREPASMHGGARAPRPERQWTMDDAIRDAAGRYTGPGRRGRNGVQING